MQEFMYSYCGCQSLKYKINGKKCLLSLTFKLLSLEPEQNTQTTEIYCVEQRHVQHKWDYRGERNKLLVNKFPIFEQVSYSRLCFRYGNSEIKKSKVHALNILE